MEAEQYTSDAGPWSGIDHFVNAHTNAPGTPANAIVGIMYEMPDRQTLNSYARLIWVRHLQPIPGNCQSPESAVKTRLFSHFITAKANQCAGIHPINNAKEPATACTAADIRLG
ncbi:hypothetical protein HBO15_12560 [Pseudomonas sp. WS 5111]|uniref:hypothetical protein n=1 Tax=unclassified Pseudomonas TaxID=196821 RepID=UPI00147318B2|nr:MULTISPECIES: hypothetical protein [unclassified Pseudomonas]NMX62998.1 hypothetical protein [Pseudomonas sp. WS 5079]NMX68011.1 hypothetical protein [Pseudomonas sp. WS 5111]NMX68181.1 hypothetical protein [Pseudomonas sp. WS 5111]NMX84174.1 hypothetical protein [Pseudomonas sp. WS 5010]